MMDLELRHSVQLALHNLATYLRQADPATINFPEVREALARIEQDRNAVYFQQGAR